MKAKKWIGITFAFVLGVFVATVGEDVVAQVQSMIGKKVTGEYTIVVNGEKLSDKGAIIDGKANVPVRALSESLGADIKVDGKTIVVTSEETPTNNQVVQLDGKYYTKYDLLNEQKKTTDLLEHLTSSVEKEEAKTEYMSGQTGIVKQVWEDGLKTLREKVGQNTQRLNSINEALKTFE
ncbi:stalk domain-containing protein [Paenibacillus lautus]|uniref:stalk domain-containing protein n=1 Tax=Paenibacillus lautus TaxID=1401 RepID=UPI003D291E40